MKQMEYILSMILAFGTCGKKLLHAPNKVDFSIINRT